MHVLVQASKCCTKLCPCVSHHRLLLFSLLALSPIHQQPAPLLTSVSKMSVAPPE